MREDRIYIVGSPDNSVRLVRAASKQQALSYVASTTYVVRVATQNELVDNLMQGVLLESCRPPEQMQINLGDANV
jgi:hypothetical protein